MKHIQQLVFKDMVLFSDHMDIMYIYFIIMNMMYIVLLINGDVVFLACEVSFAVVNLNLCSL